MNIHSISLECGYSKLSSINYQEVACDWLQKALFYLQKKRIYVTGKWQYSGTFELRPYMIKSKMVLFMCSLNSSVGGLQSDTKWHMLQVLFNWQVVLILGWF